MTDHFAVLGQPHRPWLDPDQLKEHYQKISFASHPDRKGQGGNADFDFAAVTDAYRVVSDPKLRLQHLLTLEAGAPVTAEPSAISPDVADLFMKLATLVSDIDQVLKRRAEATSNLAKS